MVEEFRLFYRRGICRTNVANPKSVVRLSFVEGVFF